MDLQTIKRFTDIQVKDPEYNPDFNVIIDIRDVDIKFNISEIREYISYVQKQDNIHGLRKDAILTLTSNQVALASLYAELQYLLEAKIMVFSTIKSIIDWLSIDNVDESEIATILENLKKEYFEV
jgi:hypothetical protein